MLSEVAHYAEVAQQAVMEAMSLARANFGQAMNIAAKGPRGDVVTKVDHAAEGLIVGILHRAFPHHAVEAEESGRHFADSEYVWLVDPLDGTNNYAYGIPLYGAAVTLCYQGEPLVTAIGEAHSSSVACAISGQGVVLNKRPLHCRPASAQAMPATALWIGYQSEYDERLAAITSMLQAQSRRVFSTWAPTIDAFLYLRGGIDAIAVYQCTGTELLGALLLLREAGADIWAADGQPITRLMDIPELSFAGAPSILGPLIRAYALASTH
jgi:myo-inositol-1(or 4)-monophosphatase